jgi:hypothetical protein
LPSTLLAGCPGDLQGAAVGVQGPADGSPINGTLYQPNGATYQISISRGGVRLQEEDFFANRWDALGGDSVVTFTSSGGTVHATLRDYATSTRLGGTVVQASGSWVC